MGFNTRIVEFWMIWGTTHFGKPPNDVNQLNGDYVVDYNNPKDIIDLIVFYCQISNDSPIRKS